MKTAWSLAICLFLTSAAYALPSFQETKDAYRESDAVLLDRHGDVLHELRVKHEGRRLPWVRLSELSPPLVKAVVHSEDRRFYEHSGVDWTALAPAVLKTVFSASPRGASTITMQLASLLDAALKPKSSRKTLRQKWDQMKAARELEKRWSKNEILEAYLNLVTFRGELQGIAAASRGLFDKDPSGLDERESLVLAALLRAPNAPAETVSKRACLLGRSLKARTECEGIKAVAEKSLAAPYSIRQRIALAPHVAYKLLAGQAQAARRAEAVFRAEKSGIHVVSTLEGELQRFATEKLRHHLAAVRSRNVSDGAVLVVENRSGQVLAYVGSAGNESKARYVDGIQAGRQAGSTLKPFLYALAFEKEVLTPASLIEDSPLELPTVTGVYRPGNYEHDFKGMVSARTALASSLNVPAVRTLSLAGTDAFVRKLRQLGFQRLEREDYYGPSLALGSADVSLWELVNAYRTLANNGLRSEMRLTFEKGARQQQRLFSREATFLVSDILSDREARSATFDLENPLSTRYWSAVKTGTSKDMRDNWCIGYSEKYTVGVWVGNFSGEPMWNVSGVTGAAPVWLDVMNYLHRGIPDTRPGPPPRIRTAKVDFPDTGSPARREWFMDGTEPAGTPSGCASVRLAAVPARAKIIYPTHESIIAIDPDIPGEYQRLFFEAETGSARFRWVLDNQGLGGSDEPVSWRPVQGRHLLSLIDERLGVIDSVEFEVRGSLQK